jgi:hypothetical protein
MNTHQAKEIIQALISKNVNFENGLSNEEILKVELKFDIKFPPDYKLFLQTTLPVSESFVNWREGLHSTETMAKIFSRLAWPLDGLLFDLKSNDFWIDVWGKMPDSYDQKELIAKQPNENRNPIFSVHQMDIIYYGYDLATYLANEFHFALPNNFDIPEKPVREIEFWSNWVDSN